METRCHHACAGVVRATSTAAGLADVVRRARNSSTKSVVHPDVNLFIARQTRGCAIAGDQSVSRETAALCPGAVLSLPLHHHGGAAKKYRLVAPVGIARICSGIFPRRTAVIVVLPLIADYYSLSVLSV